MKIIRLFIILVLPLSMIAQNDSISEVSLGEVLITATKTSRDLFDTPAQVDLISVDEIESFPLANIDDILKSCANVNVNRSWGIFSKNSSVTMRGLESSARVLVLIDGVPKNKLSGGSVNWHNIHPDQIERIEIIKGPASALYGNNAMGGVINIITKKPTESFKGKAESFYGTYNTFGGNINLSGTDLQNDKGYYWNIYGNYRQGDGYIFEAPDFLDETDVKTYLNEKGFGGKFGYQLAKDKSIEVGYNLYDELRGKGRKVFLETGSYDSIRTHQMYSRYNGGFRGGTINITAYYNFEDYYSVKESLNTSNEYRLSDAATKKDDKGFWFSYTKQVNENHKLIGGIEYKLGSVNGNEIYRTSSDKIEYYGLLDASGFFFQDEWDIFNKMFSLIAGVRYDQVSFRNSYQIITEPTKITGFDEAFEEDFEERTWNAFSPKITFQYKINQTSKVYTSIGTGFKPPKIDDLAKTGKISKGFRLANPELKPEHLVNYEIGGSKYWQFMNVSAAVYYTRGKDFQYLLATGDTVDTGGSSLKPVFIKDNIVEVQVIGGEISSSIYLQDDIEMNVSYAYNHSTILDYEINNIAYQNDLSGKYIVEVSPHLFYAGLKWNNKIVNTQINCSYTDEQWYDDANTILVDDYFLLNLNFNRNFYQHWKLHIDIINVFDHVYVDRKGQLSPGRFVLGGLSYTFTK